MFTIPSVAHSIHNASMKCNICGQTRSLTETYRGCYNECMIKCMYCGNTDNLYKDNTLKSGKTYYKCRTCSNETRRKYRQTPAGKASSIRASKKYREKHPERYKAWGLARRNIPQQPCKICGDKKTDKHHPDINKPLETVPLCRIHHMEAHNRVPLVSQSVLG